ncbi:peptidase [Enemella evansiae]|uniref:M50 family metallopeptidase n=1 Tax=Enemella evansiae TaxID=2016499 RepID=UPI000B971DC5|nr:site-2 protease family protein [Enemella evansiae]OYN94645.1 peptidase [Enemella evansiae]
MDMLIYIGGAILFFALIMASIALHEVGHMVPAKLFGVKVTEYFVGFGKTLWSFKRGETSYGIKAIPLGGYVKLIGMYPPEKKTGKVRNSGTSANPLASLIDAGREAEWADIDPADDGRFFYQKKTWQKLIVMIGGPLMNLILAFLIFWAVFGIFGVRQPQPVVGSVSQCIIPADRADQRTCQPGDPLTPAVAAGMRDGDRIVSFNGTPITDWEQLQNLIRDNRDQTAAIVVERDGQQVALTPVNTVVNGVASKWDPGKTVEAGFVGFYPRFEQVHGGPVMVVDQMTDMTVTTVVALSQFPVRVWNTATDMVTGQPRDPNGPMSIVGASRAAGEISATDQLIAGDKVRFFLSLLGGVNLFVAVFNLVPLLPLDGGHILGAIIEGIRRGAAKLFKRPDPGHLDTAKMLPVAYAVFAFIALSGAVLILADIFNPLKLF